MLLRAQIGIKKVRQHFDPIGHITLRQGLDIGDRLLAGSPAMGEALLRAGTMLDHRFDNLPQAVAA